MHIVVLRTRMCACVRVRAFVCERTRICTRAVCQYSSLAELFGMSDL